MSDGQTANPKPETRNPKRIISIIVAMAENRVIGFDNTLPWHLPEDLKRFRRITTGHHVIMGRKNHESIGRPLPNRINIVVTRNPDYLAPGCQVVHSVEEALAVAGDDPEIFIIGGAQLYQQTIGRADRLHLTLVHARPPGDTWFPELARDDWNELDRERHDSDTRHTYAYSFITLERKKANP